MWSRFIGLVLQNKLQISSHIEKKLVTKRICSLIRLITYRHSLNKKIQRLLLLLLIPKQITWQNPVGFATTLDDGSLVELIQSLTIHWFKKVIVDLFMLEWCS